MIYFLTVNYFSQNLIAKLLNSLPAKYQSEYRTVIINNSPEDVEIQKLSSETVTIIEAGRNLGFGQACNLGIKWIYHQDKQGIIWIINPDAYLAENTLEKVNPFFATYPELSILGTIIHTPSSEVWFAGGRFIPLTGAIITANILENTDSAYVACDWVSGCSTLVNLGNFSESPLFDPVYFLYYEDFDFCLRYGNLGHLVAVTKQFDAIHQPSSITNRNIFLKTQHSTYSYLLTLAKYTNIAVFIIRLARLIAYALILLPIKPHVAFGKLYGVFIYFQRSPNF
ncbi:glycosyl transferase [Calothrix brevissima NIES-22]|nr:glycosyl transferase [Calothrix brevissima NIES-22]